MIKIDFKQNLGNRKIQKFLHCVWFREKMSSNCSSTKINHLPKLFSLNSVHFHLYKNRFLFLLVHMLGLFSVDLFYFTAFSSLLSVCFVMTFDKHQRALTNTPQQLTRRARSFQNVNKLLWIKANYLQSLWSEAKKTKNVVKVISKLQVTIGKCTEWKFEDFSVTQILRGISFGESRSPKTAFESW